MCVQLIILNGYTIPATPLEVIDTHAPLNWEGNSVEVANYLNKNPDNKSIFSIYVPSIPFFTNRTTFDTYYPGSFISIYPILNATDSPSIEKEC